MDDRVDLRFGQRAAAAELEHDRRGRLGALAQEDAGRLDGEMHARLLDGIDGFDGAGEVHFARGAQLLAFEPRGSRPSAWTRSSCRRRVRSWAGPPPPASSWR